MNQTPLLDQIRVYSEALVDDLPEVTTQPEPTVVAIPATRRRSRNVWVAVAVAVVTVLIIGIIPILLNGEETQPAVTVPVTIVDEAPVTTIVGEAVPEPAEPLPLVAEIPWSIEDIPSDAESGVFDTPIGLVSWVSLPIDVDTRPFAGCFATGDEGVGECHVRDVMAWPSGFATYQEALAPLGQPPVPAKFWISTDGLNWREESLPSDGRLTLDNGVYWLMSEEPNGLWHTTNGSTWHEIDSTGLAPPGSSVSPTWGKGYTSPVTAGDLTLIYGEFHENEYPDRFEQSLYIIDDNGVTRTEVPWPAMQRANLFFGTGDWIYAYTAEIRSDDATITVWRTNDGLLWTQIGPLGIVEESGLPAKSLHFEPTLDGRLMASNYELSRPVWETTDGITWEPVDLPPPPSVDGSTTPYTDFPELLDSGWFANTGRNRGSQDGGTWWMKVGDSWFPLADLDHPGWPMRVSSVGHTTFFSSENALWVMSLKTTD